MDVNLLKRAFLTLSTPDLRVKYDTARARPHSGPRPAQVVSLEEFTEHKSVDPDGLCWIYDCRCGGTYRIAERDMEQDQHLVGCSSCSEVVWVGYEVADEDES